MSAPVQEPPAPERSPEKGQHSVLAQLSAALENPDIKVLEWSEDGRGVLVHTELYEEEMGRNKELFPELAALGCVAALQAWLLGCGFTLGGAKHPCGSGDVRGSASGRLAPLRPLYQYINFNMPELMHPAAEEEEVPELAQQSQVPAAPRMATAPQLEGTWTSSAVQMPAPGADDKSMQVDIDRMLRYAAHLVPPLFPQYK
ncbi:protein c16orf86 like protein [Limosa lapponica baueri]|uniref:Protein c16orf86 like protein n=1 Tax=Limosa lapponica baueri TaxID=1758121 RepID=A0A2I0U8R4_LIMLA|nr:protein c16orf86 like protein [Limosa lapponica baueri]